MRLRSVVIAAINLAMSIALATVNDLKNPAFRRGWAKLQLEAQGSSFRAFAQEEGVSHQAISQALMGGGSRHLQEAIAKRLGLPPRQLFPELYDGQGNRLGRTREKQRSTRDMSCNVEEGRAA